MINSTTMSKTPQKNTRKTEPKEVKPSARTHVKIILSEKTDVWFPRQLVKAVGVFHVKITDISQWFLTAPGEITPFLVTFLSRLEKVFGGDAELIKFVDSLPKEGLEACINLMLEMKYSFPNDTPLPGKKVETEWPEFLFERIQLCTEPETLEKLCRSYPWYIAASRRVVTLQHVSKKGLTKAFLRAVGKIATTDPTLAFALAPTTLHENTLVAPEIAKFFTCDPLQARKLDIGTTYKTVIEEKQFKHIELGKRNKIEERPSQELAASRVSKVMAFLRDDKGEFPWHHPTRVDTGIILAGGFPCAALLSEEKYQEILPKTDLDFFVYSPSDEGQREMAAIILKHVEKLGGKLQQVIMGNTEADAAKILKTACVYRVDGLEREVQIIFPFAFSPLGVLINFDSTFIQVGYQEEAMITSTVRAGDEAPVVKKRFLPSFLATPGFCFFTPRSESLITRYNIRYYRLTKMLTRGFEPVSDERGHLLYPSKIFFSTRWRLALEGPKKKDETWMRASAIRYYIIRKNIKREVLEKLLGVEELKKNEEKAMLTLPDDFFTDKEMFESTMLNARVSAESFNGQSNYHRISIWGPNQKPAEDDEHNFGCWAAKPEVTWVDVSSDEALANFSPQGATLSNGFDIYTAGVNNTLPIPADGETDDLYEFNVLLRNVEVLAPEREYNLAAPQERPLKTRFVPFPDERAQYKSDVYKKCGEEPVRTIEGVFLFSDFKTEEQIDADYVAHQKAREARTEKFMRKLELKKQMILQREARELKARQEAFDKRVAELKAKGELPGKHDLKYEASLKEDAEKLKEREAERIKAKADRQARRKATDEKGKEELDSEESAEEKKDANEETRDPRDLKIATLVSHIDFRDLHRYVAMPKEASWIPVEELPFMMKAFAKGEKEYIAKNKTVIKRSDGMVKIRATVAFTPCMIFDVDDLFLPQRSLDTHSKRRYNAVVKLANLTRWIVKAHEHKGVLTSDSSRKMILAALQEELKDAEKKDGSKAYMPVTEFLRAIRHVANDAEFEETSNKMACTKPHAAKGLVGEMPVLFCSRLYVTRHE